MKKHAKKSNPTPKEAAKNQADPLLNNLNIAIGVQPKYVYKDGTSMEMDNSEYLRIIRSTHDEIAKGNMEPLVKALMAQTETLSAIMLKNTHLMNTTTNKDLYQLHANIALRAQEQTRRTLTAVNDIVNPKKIIAVKEMTSNTQNNLIVTKENSKSENKLLDTAIQDGDIYVADILKQKAMS